MGTRATLSLLDLIAFGLSTKVSYSLRIRGSEGVIEKEGPKALEGGGNFSIPELQEGRKSPQHHITLNFGWGRTSKMVLVWQLGYR